MRATRPILVAATSGADPTTVPRLVALCERFAIGYAEEQARYANFPAGHPLHLGYDLGVDWTPNSAVKVSLTGFYEFFRDELVTQATPVKRPSRGADQSRADGTLPSKEQLNNGIVTVITAPVGGAYAAMGADMAAVLDDGANLRTLFQADIVLTGVSRTSKTPLAIYLAHRGYKTGNVPLVPGMEPPKELLEVDPRKVFGLVASQATLVGTRIWAFLPV